jgi:hypothetical protein
LFLFALSSRYGNLELTLALSLLLLHRCPNKEACSHDKTELAASMENVSPFDHASKPTNWSMYGQQLCKEGYTGILCSLCKPGYGQTDPFHSRACAGDSKGQAAKAPVIVTLVVVLASIYGFIQWTVSKNIQEIHSHLTGDQAQHIEATEVIKALIMYVQVCGFCTASRSVRH